MPQDQQDHAKALQTIGFVSVRFPETQNGNYTVFGEDFCGFTQRALNLLAKRGITFKYHAFNGDRQARDVIRKIASNHPTIPMVFRGEGYGKYRFTGGATELEKELNSSN